jgi:antirestriction protein ArdC
VRSSAFTQFARQPCPRQFPVPHDGLRRDLQHLSRFFNTQAAEEPEFDHLRTPRIELAETDQCIVQCTELRGGATLAHETTHWTAHESRLARDFGNKRFGSEGYAIEELVAELGAAFLCADLDLTLEPREDHAAYLANWLDVLKADSRAIFAAASHAQRAADFINGLQPASAG